MGPVCQLSRERGLLKAGPEVSATFNPTPPVVPPGLEHIARRVCGCWASAVRRGHSPPASEAGGGRGGEDPTRCLVTREAMAQ